MSQLIGWLYASNFTTIVFPRYVTLSPSINFDPPHISFLPLTSISNSLELEMDEDSAKVLVVFFNAMIQLFDVTLIQKAEHFLFKLPAAFAGNNFHQLYFLSHGLLHNAVEFRVDLAAAIVDVMQIQFEFGHEVYWRVTGLESVKQCV